MKERAGADDAFAQFLIAHRPELVNLARRLYRLQVADAEDLVQEALIKTAERWTGLRDPQAFARRCVVTAGIDRHRRLIRRPKELQVEVRERDLRAYSDEPPNEVGATMEAALAALPLLSRQVLLLRYYLGLSEQETADLLHRPLGSVKSASHRGIAQLRELLPMGTPTNDGEDLHERV